MDSSGDESSVFRIETDLLLKLTEPFKHILDATETDANIIHTKNRTWTEISKEYNANRLFKKKTCRELRKTYQRMMIKNRNKSIDLQVDDDKKPKFKKIKLSYESSGDTSQDNSSAVLGSSDTFPGVKVLKSFPPGLVPGKKKKDVLSKNCLVIMKPISQSQLKSMKVQKSVQQGSSQKPSEASVPSSVPFLNVSQKPGTPASNASCKVDVVDLESGNIVTGVTTQMMTLTSNVITKGESGLCSAASSPLPPPQASSPSSPYAASPSRNRQASPSLAFTASNFSNTPGSATLTMSTAQTKTHTAISVSSAGSTRPHQSSEEEELKKTVVHTYSKIHPHVLPKTVSVSTPPGVQPVKRLMLSTSAPTKCIVHLSNSRPSIVVAAKPGLDSTPPKSASHTTANDVKFITPPKVASGKPLNLNLIPVSSPLKVVSSVSTSATPASNQPKVVSCGCGNVASTTSSPKISICRPDTTVVTSTPPKVADCKPGTSNAVCSPQRVVGCQSTNFTVSGIASASSRAVGTPTKSGMPKYTRCQVVPASQALAFLSSRNMVRSVSVESAATTVPQSTSATATPVESQPTTATTAVNTSTTEATGFSTSVLSTAPSLEEGHDEGVSVAMAEPEILSIRVLEANLDVRAAQARVEAEEALREEALAKLAMTRAEMDYQALRHRIELRHMRKLNAQALQHAKELHAAALALRRKE